MNRALFIASIALLTSPFAALAYASNPRFQLVDTRVETTAPSTSADSRYSLDARAELSSTELPKSTARFALKFANGISCEAAGDAVFTNGFE